MRLREISDVTRFWSIISDIKIEEEIDKHRKMKESLFKIENNLD